MTNPNKYYTIVQGQPLERPYPSVTTITNVLSKPALYGYYAKWGAVEAKRLSEEAMTIGQELHHQIRNYFTNTQPVHTKLQNLRPVMNAFENFKRFVDEYRPSPLLIEHEVVSHEHQYAGTLDATVLIGDRIILIDWKTSSGIYSEYLLQVEAYYRALSSERTFTVESAVQVPDELWIVRLDKEKPIQYTNNTKDVAKLTPDSPRFQAFLGLLATFNWLEKGAA